MAQSLDQIAKSLPDNLAAERAVFRFLAGGGPGGRYGGPTSGREIEGNTQVVQMLFNMLIRYAMVGRAESKQAFEALLRHLPRDKFNVLMARSDLDKMSRQCGELTTQLNRSIREIQSEWREFERYAQRENLYGTDAFKEREAFRKRHVKDLEARKREVDQLAGNLVWSRIVPYSEGYIR